MMNPEVKVKWLEALRSGEYRQTRYTLQSPSHGFCCLGVLCDIYTKEVGGSWEYDYCESSCAHTLKVGEESAQTELPDCVVEWAGLEVRSPEVTNPFCEGEVAFCTLASLNDDGKDFEFIADLIDRDL